MRGIAQVVILALVCTTMLQSFVDGKKQKKTNRHKSAFDALNDDLVPNHVRRPNSNSRQKRESGSTIIPYVGMPCGFAATKDCNNYGPSYNENEKFIITCPVGGRQATNACPVPKSNGTILSCQGSNSQGFYCKNCVPWGQTCRKDSDCCVGFLEGMNSYPLPLVMKPFCHRPFILGIGGIQIKAATGTCTSCLHSRDPCPNAGSTMPMCGKLNYTSSTAKCRSRYTGGKGGLDRKGHNNQMGWLFDYISPDPCTPEADLAKIGNEVYPMDGSSQCYLQGVHDLAETAYVNSYFCDCPEDQLTGYSCQVNNTVTQLLSGLGPLASTTDNGKRCQKCGLWGQTCGASGTKPCCDNHDCVQGECVPQTCTRIGDKTNYLGEQTECCGAPKFFRDLKEGRCTDNLCTPSIGAYCETDWDCCGLTHVCQKNSKLSLNGTCQLCLEDGVAVPGRKCTSIYDCCSSNKLYSEGLGFDDYSICQPLEPNGVNYCEACIPQNEACTQWNHCCGGYTCDNSGTQTCSIPPETGEDEEAPDDTDRDAELAAVVGNDTNPEG